MKNKLSLTSILGIILLSIVVFGSVICLTIWENDLQNARRVLEYTDYLPIFILLFFTVLFFFIAIGLFAKANWASVLLLWSFYLAIAAYSLLILYNLEDSFRRSESFFIGFGFTIAVYCFLFAGILFLNTRAVRAELGIDEETSFRIKE